MTVLDPELLPEEPWLRIAELVDAGDVSSLEAFIEALPPSELARSISRLEQDQQTALLTLLSPEDAADVIEDVSEAQAGELLAELPPERAADIVEEMESDERADVLAELERDEAEAILREMEPETALDVRLLLTYPPDTAGGIMVTDLLSYEEGLRVADVTADLRANGPTYSDYEIQYAYVVSTTGVLRGVLRLRDLLFASQDALLTSVMIDEPVQVRAQAHLDELRGLFEHYDFIGVPVTDAAGRLLGVVRRADMREASEGQASRDFREASGIVGGEELRSLPLATRSARRLSWLSINIVLNIVAASVIALYQDTLEKAITLAVFLPIISDMSGCSGNQAVAVSIRELSLGLVKPREILRVLAKEAGLGLINGAVLGMLLGGAALLWKGNPYLGLVVAVALAANTLIAVSLGGVLPLALKGLRQDPALVSGPVLTTVTDMCGFFLVLQLATLLLPRLG
jgi:magnesium transporter